MALLICPSACRLRRLAQNGPGARHFSCKFSHKRDLAKLLLNSLLRGPCVILYIQVLDRRSCRDPFSEVLPWKILQVPCPRGACMKALVGGTWVLVSRSCKIRSSSKVLLRRSCALLSGVLAWRRNLVTVFYKSLWEALVEMTCCRVHLHDLVPVLVRRFWRGPGEIL